MCFQNNRSTSRRCEGRPGDFNADLPVISFIQHAGLPTTHLHYLGCCDNQLNLPMMARSQWRAWQAETATLLTELLGVVMACALVGRSRATHHRQANPKPRTFGPHPKGRHPAELSDDERQAILAVLDRDEYADLSVAQVWARELDEGRYYCSQRTMGRILAAAGQSGERRRQATHPPRTIPELVATASNDVWSWDITKLRGPAKGIWYHAYVVIDIFSRYVVGWRIETIEDGELAADLVAEAITTQGTAPGYLHADGGAAMTSKPLASLLSDLNRLSAGPRPATSNTDRRFSWGIGPTPPVRRSAAAGAGW